MLWQILWGPTVEKKLREGALTTFYAFKSDVYDNNVMIMIFSFSFQYNNVTVISLSLQYVRQRRRLMLELILRV